MRILERSVNNPDKCSGRNDDVGMKKIYGENINHQTMSGSIGYSNAISSGKRTPSGVVSSKDSTQAIQGWMAQSNEKVDKRYEEFEHVRSILKNAWNTSYKAQLRKASVPKPIQTPFRVVNNCGDLLLRQQYACGGVCQTPQSRPQLKGLKQHLGSISNSCSTSTAHNDYQRNTSVPAAACNGKYVYDGSDYVTFLKQQAMSRKYNSLTFSGGDNSYASQTVLKSVRRR